MKKVLIFTLLFSILLPIFVKAQDGEIVQDKITILKGEVLQIILQESRNIPGTDVEGNYQKLKVKILEGEKTGEIILIENDYLNLEVGEKFYLMETIREDGNIYYSVHDKYRLPVIYFFIALFIFCVFLFGGMQGLRGLLSLIGSILLIFFVLMPGILHGYSPILVTIGVSSLIIILGSYITHGFNKTTTSAVVGMLITVVFTGILAYFAVSWAGLSGFESEEAVFLNWNTRGSIDFVGLLFGGIMIGLLGVLYDASIGQAISVEELADAGKHLTRKEIFKRVLRMGREHIGALVDTLAIAYVGASLPLLLLFYGEHVGPLGQIINREIFATEIIRTIIGSIGLILAVPITTFISVWMLVKKER